MAQEPADSINYPGDQDDFGDAPPGYKDHLEKAFVHKAGLGPHPGKYQGPPHEIRHGPAREDRQEPTEGDIARLIEEEHPGETQELLAKREAVQPGPAQETLEQPPRGGGSKGQSQKPPGRGTPAALGQQAVAPEPPAGEF
jgi:hypothetical protein